MVAGALLCTWPLPDVGVLSQAWPGCAEHALLGASRPDTKLRLTPLNQAQRVRLGRG